MRYLDSCQQHPASELQALQVATYLATPWFSYQCIQPDDAASAAHNDHGTQLLAIHAGMLRRLQHLVQWLSPLRPCVIARQNRPPEANKRVYAFIFAIFTVLAPFGPFIDVY